MIQFRPFLLVALIVCSSKAFPQKQTNPDLAFSKYFSGIRHAFVIYQPTASGHKEADDLMIETLVTYLKTIGLERVEAGLESSFKARDIKSYCDLVFVFPSWTFERNTYTAVNIKMRTCTGDYFDFNAPVRIKSSRNDISKSFPPMLEATIGKQKEYISENRLELPCDMTNWRDEKLRQHFQEKGFNSTEGIYERFSAIDKTAKYRIAIVREDERYEIIYLSGAPNHLDWKEGERKGKVLSTSATNVYNLEWKMPDKSINNEVKMMFELGFLYVVNGREKEEFIKSYPTLFSTSYEASLSDRYGSGFALSKDGYVVTNHHVVEGSKKIKIRGVNEDFNKSYTAKIVVEDKNNDLAILKIDDPDFKTLDQIPYIITNKTADVGSSVYLMGYPLKTSMGEEMKLTNGIISSRSGHKGNITTYQLSAASQPGNSGGPVFDEKGVLVGIVNAKLAGAENATYAIKTVYLLNLIENLPTTVELNQKNSLAGKPLNEQVKSIKRFTYIIESK